MNQANNLIGKLVQIPVYVRVWSMEGREGVTYNISSDGGITEIKCYTNINSVRHCYLFWPRRNYCGGFSLMYIAYFFGAYTFGFALFYAVGSFKSFSDRLM